MYFYLYTRTNWWYNKLNIYKVGLFGDELMNNRNSTYITSEPDVGIFNNIWIIYNEDRNFFDALLKNEMDIYRYNGSGGTEFYYNFSQNLENIINNILLDCNINFNKLNQDEISKINSKLKNKNDPIKSLVLKKKNNNKIILYPFQKECIKSIINRFNNNENKCIINWICRLGKTITTIYLLLKLDFKKILIGVPSIQLLYQWQEKIKKYCKHKIVIIGDSNINNITEEYKDNKYIIILTTFLSSYKVKQLDFDIKILDEAHHVTYENININTDRKNRAIIDIPSNYQLSLTATMKISENKKIIGNNNVNLFGNIIDSKSLDWAIENKYVCDYNICCPIINIENIQMHFDNFSLDIKKELFIDLYVSCISMLQILKNNKHRYIINYTNEKKNAKICSTIINKMLEFNEFKHLKDLLSNLVIVSDNSNDFNKLIKQFKGNKYGIMNCCYKLGEGFDEKIIDTVCISENMVSNIRILQSLLRPHTKDIKNNPDKKALILLPISNIDIKKDLSTDKFKKILNVIDIISNTDKNIDQKVNIVNINQAIPKDIVNQYYEIDYIFNESIKLMLIHKNLINGCSYNKLKEIILKLGGRTNNKLSLQEDYLKKIKLHNLLSISNVELILYKNDRDWLDLYNMQKDNYHNFYNFKQKYGKIYNKEDYIKLSYLDNKAPLYSDLENIYKIYGYNVDFWINPVGNLCEF